MRRWHLAMRRADDPRGAIFLIGSDRDKGRMRRKLRVVAMTSPIWSFMLVRR